MRPIEKVSQDTVWEHWRQVEGLDSLITRSDILDTLPKDLQWYRCIIQPIDIRRLYVISSQDWHHISGRTFRVLDAARNIENNSGDIKPLHIIENIREKVRFIKSGGELDRGLITITDSPSLSGPFTIIEGNRRSVAFACCRMLSGNTVFVGTSPGVVDCTWAKAPYMTFLENR
jgi:hypothetical protein